MNIVLYSRLDVCIVENVSRSIEKHIRTAKARVTSANNHNIFYFLLTNSIDYSGKVPPAQHLIRKHHTLLLVYHGRKPFVEVGMEVLPSTMR
jgi:hypothetical protein